VLRPNCTLTFFSGNMMVPCNAIVCSSTSSVPGC
jgi:hypothetical protein